MRRQSIGRRLVLAGAGGLLASPAVLRAQGVANGVALVIGNSKYHWEAALPNVKRDAPDIARMFNSYGLKTELVQDAGRGAMDQALQHFGKASKGAKLAAFYFAGHGATWGRDSYLVPVDADLGDPGAVETLIKTISIGPLVREAANRLFVYDSCRNNPADGWRQVESERNAFASDQRPGAPLSPNSLVLFSTAPGRIALDGPVGQNSPFAAAFLRQLQPDTIDLPSVVPRLRRDLLIATEGKQVLWSRNNFQQPFVLKAPRNRERISVSGGAGWAGDPARIVELTKAYAYARENGLDLPPGLIAHRPAANSRDARKIGSFQFTNRTKLGEDPALLVVMSVEGQTAEVIQSIKGVYNGKTKQTEPGTLWRFVTGRISGDRLEYVPRDGSPPWVFAWSDASSGSFTLKSRPAYTSRLTRLDG